MSVYVRKITGQQYVYFQWYEGGRKIEEYIGRKDDPSITSRLLAKYSEHQEYDLETFCSRIHEVTGFKIDPREARRRLLEADKPQAPVNIQIEREFLGSELLPLLDDAMTLRIYTPDEIAALKRARQILDKKSKERGKKVARGGR
jgi:hypothetical protein